MMYRLQASMVIGLSLPTPLRRSRRSFSSTLTFCNMSTFDSSALTHSIHLPSQPSRPVQIVAAPGLSPSDFRTAIECSLFKQWLMNMEGDKGVLADGTISLEKVLIQGVDYFGKRVGFLKFKADVVDKETGNKLPGIVFARGPAVAILILLESEGETYAVLTEQARVATGRILLELPAGMLDDDKGDFVGTAAREVEEETGIQLNVGDMIEGGCDEDLSVFLCKKQVSKEIIEQLQEKQTGLQDHGEFIKVRVVPYAKLWRCTPDAKVLMAVALYEMAKKEGLLPQD